MSARMAIVLVALVAAACTAAGAQPSPPAAPITGAPNEIVARYYQAIDNICQTGVTAESIALYEAVDKLWNAQPTGGGRGSNFGGARDPHMAWRACFQSPGWD